MFIKNPSQNKKKGLRLTKELIDSEQTRQNYNVMGFIRETSLQKRRRKFDLGYFMFSLFLKFFRQF